MSKEIIIDGVNVAECEYSCVCLTDDSQERIACNSSCHNKNTKYSVCVYNPNCYYKQLKRLQAENEELKEENELITDYTELFKISGKCFFDAARRCNYINDLVKYKKALEEIRELINETCWDYTDISIIPVKDKMLEVISEVLR